MAAVLPAPASTKNAWICPTCRHGSPDPRDELAHLDAHRQLARFLNEWDAAVVSDREKERKRRPTLAVLAALTAVVALVAGVVFWGLGHTGGSSRPVAAPVPSVPAPTPAPVLTQPPPDVPVQPPAVSPPTSPVPEQASPSGPVPPVLAPAPIPVGVQALLPSAGPAVASDDAVATAAPVPTPPAPARSTSLKSLGAGPAAAAPTYLVKICLIDTCLTIPGGASRA